MGNVYERFRAISFPIHHLLPLLSVALVLAAIGTLWIDGATQSYIPPNFSYSADFNTTNNAYDASNNRYTGERYAAGSLYYRVVGQADGVVTIESERRNTDLSGKPLDRIVRRYKVQSYTGQYVGTAGQSYVFAPRNLRKGQNFTYRHTTYDAPANMHYKDEHIIDGVAVYRYETTLDPIRTQDLTHVLTLQLWVEPVTGWLVKFEETSVAHRYDPATNQPQPYSRSSTVSTLESIRQQASYARLLRYRQLPRL